MWAHYRKTFLGIQVVIALVTCFAVLATGYRIPVAAVFFTVMQFGAVLGAMWAVRIKGTFELHR